MPPYRTSKVPEQREFTHKQGTISMLLILASMSIENKCDSYVSGGNQTSPAKLSLSSAAQVSKNALFSLVLFLHKHAFFGEKEESRLFSCLTGNRHLSWKVGEKLRLLDLSSIRSPGESHSSGYSSYAAVELA